MLHSVESSVNFCAGLQGQLMWIVGKLQRCHFSWSVHLVCLQQMTGSDRQLVIPLSESAQHLSAASALRSHTSAEYVYSKFIFHEMVHAVGCSNGVLAPR
jgi:hypothetical protein